MEEKEWKIRQFWILSKKIISNERGNSGITSTAVFQSQELARKACEEYLIKSFRWTGNIGEKCGFCSYCGGDSILYSIKPHFWKREPDRYRDIPPGAKNLKILESKGEEKWFVGWKQKCNKCGGKYAYDLYHNASRGMYERGTNKEKSSNGYTGYIGCLVIIILLILVIIIFK